MSNITILRTPDDEDFSYRLRCPNCGENCWSHNEVGILCQGSKEAPHPPCEMELMKIHPCLKGSGKTQVRPC